VEKRKTFVHEELIQQVQGKSNVKKPAFAKIFRDRDSKESKEGKDSSKDTLRESKEMKSRPVSEGRCPDGKVNILQKLKQKK
jgi:hypothetical protein